MRKNKYLVISKEQGHVYCYFESPKHHMTVEEIRINEGYIRLPLSKLDEECDVSLYPNKTYFVYEP